MWWFAIGSAIIVGPALFTGIVLLHGEEWYRRACVALHLALILEALVSLGDSKYSHVLVMLRVVEPLYESVPQLMLQIYVLLLEWDNDVTQWVSWRLLSILVSLLSLAYATTGLVAEQPLSQLSPTAGVSRSCCLRLAVRPFRWITEVAFGTVPANSRVELHTSSWSAQRFVWAFLLYQGLEIAARFISLALLALVLRAYFFPVFLWLWISRWVILRRSLGEGGEVLHFRSQLRLVGMPFMDSVMDKLKSYDMGCALTTAEFAAFVAVGNLVSTNEPGQMPASVGLVWTFIAVACMAGKLVLGFLVVRPFKRTVSFGLGPGDKPGGQNPGGRHPHAGDGGDRDVELGRSSRGSDLGTSWGERYRVGGGRGGTAVVREMGGPERRQGGHMYEDVPLPHPVYYNGTVQARFY